MKEKENTQLSIVIPTYNRADFLDLSLEMHIPLVRQFNIAIYIVDDASTDNTSKIVSEWMNEYEYLFYSRNKKNLGPDLNVEAALKMPETDYVWLLGDTSKIKKSVFERVVQLCLGDYDLILLNSTQRVCDVRSQLIQDKKTLLSSLGWQMTHLSVLIYNRKVIKHANFLRFSNTFFLQTGIIFESFAYRDDVRVSWNQDLSIETLRKGGLKTVSYWQKNTFEIWIKKWANLVLSLPPVYSLECKLKAIQDHSNKSQIFSFKSLLSLRAKGFYSMNHYFLYRKYFGIALGRDPVFKFLSVAVLPKIFVRFLIRIFKMKFFSLGNKST